MAIQALGGDGGAGSTQAGGSGGDANQSGAGEGAGAAGTSPSGNGGDASSGAGGGGGADGSLMSAGGGRGGDGANGISSSGVGSGGGGGGGGGVGLPSQGTVSGGAFGGRGGDGGTGEAVYQQYGNGGSGGDGGDGLVMTGSGNTTTILAGASVLGGGGGNGGNGSYDQGSGIPGAGGAGGDGGDGLFAADGNTVVNAGTIVGGAAGAGGGADDGLEATAAAGSYGAGIIGSDLSVTNSGRVSAGFDSLGNLRNDAILFTSGTNVLTLSSGGTVGTVDGNVSVSGTLDIRSGGTQAGLSGGMLVLSAAATTVIVESGVTIEDMISGFVAGDLLDFRVGYSTNLEIVFTASATGGTLRLFNVTNPNVVVAEATVVGAYTSGVFSLANSSGSADEKIGFTATPSLGFAPGDIVRSSIPGSSALAVVDRYNSDFSLYQEDTVTKASNGDYTFHFQNGSFFNGKSFASFDNVTNSSGLLLNQTLYNSAGQTIQQTQFNANGSIYLQDNVVYPAAGQVLYQYRSGSFFTGKSFSAFDNLATPSNTLLSQELYNRDNSHTFTVPGSGLTLTAVKNDTFNVSGSNDTARFNATGFGKDTFSGYKAGDIFSFSTSIFANYQALQQHVSGSSSAVITTSANDTLTLSNVAVSSLSSGMFKFS